MKKKILQYSIAAVIDLLIALWIMYAQGMFEIIGEAPAAAISIMCDAFFVPGILTALFGVLMWIATTGLFDSIGYAARTALHIILPTSLKERKSFYDYKHEKEEKREGSRPPYFLLVVGIGFIAVSMVLLAVWASL